MSQKHLVRFARTTLGLDSSLDIRCSALGSRGSDRTYYRLEWGARQSAIVVAYDPRRTENAYFADIARFLDAIGVRAPRVYGHDRERCLMVVEDLGHEDLYALRHAPWSDRQSLYERTLIVVGRLHKSDPRGVVSAGLTLMEPFDAALYRWERDYFRENFVRGICNLTLATEVDRALECGLSALAERLMAGSTSLVHRDLQSQNVMIRGAKPYLIDFQGMRVGSPFYDLASLLCDPYVDFTAEEREELLLFSHRLFQGHLEGETFQRRFWDAAVQRLMQALGAYGFLARVKGLGRFLDHIPAGLANLQLAASAASIPVLPDVLEECRKSLTPPFPASQGRNPASP